MTGKLPPSACVAQSLEGAKLNAPAAVRNAQYICDLLKSHAPQKGRALELASGTGQHVVAFAGALPGLQWHPTEISDERIASINAYRADVPEARIEPAVRLDATTEGWHESIASQDCIVLINLLHLISTPRAKTLVSEAIAALAPSGKFFLYGPFNRGGQLTSDGDARFHNQLSEADPAIGYKNDGDIEAWMRAAGAGEVMRIEMPANNLAFIAAR